MRPIPDLNGRGNGGERAHYSCRNGKALGNCDGFGSARVRDVEPHVLAVVREYAERFSVRSDPDAGHTITKRIAAIADRERIEGELARIADKTLRVDDDFYSDKITRDRRDRLVERFEADANRLRETLAAIETVVDGPTVEEFVVAADELDELWDVATPAERNRLFRAAGLLKVEIRRSRATGSRSRTG